MNYVNLSLVVASYKGSKRIRTLINSILLGKAIPKEIIIVCVSEEYNKYLFNLKKFMNLANIIIIRVKLKNQIFQRQTGLKFAKENYILQLDDDLIVEKNTISLMYNHVSKNHYKKIFCGNLIDKNKNPLDKRWLSYYKNYNIFRFILFVLNGFRKIEPNTIIKSGRPIPNFKNCNNIYQWLNSSLCFHNKALNDYKFFNTKGKSYYEDIFTSHSFLQQGYQLIKIKSSRLIHPETKQINLNEFISAFKNQKKIVKTFNKSQILMYLDIFVFSFFYIGKIIKKKFI